MAFSDRSTRKRYPSAAVDWVDAGGVGTGAATGGGAAATGGGGAVSALENSAMIYPSSIRNALWRTLQQPGQVSGQPRQVSTVLSPCLYFQIKKREFRPADKVAKS